MEAELRASDVAIDQAGIGIILLESCLGSGSCSDLQEGRRHWGPRSSNLRILWVVAITGSVRYPTDPTAVGHCDRHCVATGRNQVAECAPLCDLRHFL